MTGTAPFAACRPKAQRGGALLGEPAAVARLPPADRAGQCLRGLLLVDVVKERRWAQIECARELGDRAQSRLASHAFQKRDFRAMQVAGSAGGFLGKASCEPRRP